MRILIVLLYHVLMRFLLLLFLMFFGHINCTTLSYPSDDDEYNGNKDEAET